MSFNLNCRLLPFPADGFATLTEVDIEDQAGIGEHQFIFLFQFFPHFTEYIPPGLDTGIQPQCQGNKLEY